MAGRHPRYPPPPAPPWGGGPPGAPGGPPPGPPPGLPGARGYAAGHQYVPARRPPRRTAGGTIVGVLGAVAAAIVIGVLGVAAFGSGDGRSVDAGTRSAGRADRSLATGNKLYRTGPLATFGCRLPAIVPGGGASMKRFMDALSDCLDASWERQFDRSRQRYAPPKRIFWQTEGRSPCGTYPSPGAAAFYCPANNTMYVGVDHVVRAAGNEPVSHFAVYARVIAHEYGHHVQESAGILDYGHFRMEDPDISVRNDASRRIELQAQCFAGIFLGAERRTLPMTREQYVAMIVDVRARGDENQPADKHDHGSGRNYAGWVERGIRDRAVGDCNTWTAAAADVD